MRKVFFLLVMILLCAQAPVFAQDKSSAQEMGRGQIDFNAAGFFTFGPMVNVGFRVGPSTFIDGSFRWSYPGIVYQMVETEGFENEASPSGGGAGIRVTHCIFIGDSPNCMYVGGIFQFTWGGSSYTDSEYPTDSWEREWKGYAVMFNMGYRFRFQSGFYMMVGGMLGFHNQYKSEWHYTNNSFNKTVYNDPEGVRLIGMIEFSIGTEFGK